MDKNSNTGWYVLGGLALLCLIGYNMNKSGSSGIVQLPSPDSNSVPDTATETEIILTGKK